MISKSVVKPHYIFKTYFRNYSMRQPFFTVAIKGRKVILVRLEYKEGMGQQVS
jgi:hypothetical protein